MNQNGIFFDGPIQLDGNIHRFSADMIKKKKDVWYVARSLVFQGNDCLIVCYGSWSDSEANFQYQLWKDNLYLCHPIDEMPMCGFKHFRKRWIQKHSIKLRKCNRT